MLSLILSHREHRYIEISKGSLKIIFRNFDRVYLWLP